MTDANYKPYVAAEVGIHEIGHAVAYHGLDFYGQTLHERSDWLSISGWSSSAPDKSPNTVSAHLVKTRSAAQTGGLPKTDAGYEAPVSDYGCFHPAEDFAEAYRMYILNPVFLEQKYPKKYQFMIDVVEPMFTT
jgi:Mlc titration factor MtfA (ptsG expression regulator)